MAVDPNIKKKADDIRNKIYGKEVRESLASGLEAMSSDVIENEGRQSVVESRQDGVESQWQSVIDETTNLDVVSAPEIIAARNGEANLKARLDKTTAQLEHIDYKEINPHAYEEYLENEDWTTVIHKIFEENESGVIKFPVGTYTFKTPIGRMKNGFIISGVNRYQTTFNIDLTGDYFVRAGLESGFMNIGIRIDHMSSYPKTIFEYNSNALGVTHPGKTWVFDVNNIYFDNDYKNVTEDRLPNLFGVYAQNFDDNGEPNNLCSYVYFFNPHDIQFSGVNKFADFKLTQKDGGSQVWATEVNFEKIRGARLKKGLEIRIDNQSSFNTDQTSDIYLTDVSFQGNNEGSFGNENWTQTEFLNVYGDERRNVRVNLQGATKFWDTDFSGYLDYGNVEINGEFLFSDWDSSTTENRKLGFDLGRNSNVDWIGRNPYERRIERGTNNRFIRVTPTDNDGGGVGELFQNSPEYYGYGSGFLTDFKSFHNVNDPNRTSDNITEFYNRSHGGSKLTSIKWGDIPDFEISVGGTPTLKHNHIGPSRQARSTHNDWFGANGAKFEIGGYGGQYSIEPGESVEHSATFKESFNGIPFVSVSLTEAYAGRFIVARIDPTSEGFTVRIKNIGDSIGGVSLQWFAVGVGYV